MHQTFTNPRRRRACTRRLLAAPILGLLAAAFMLLAPGLASADTSSSLTIVGTSDVSDSGLVPNLIQPAFHAAYPQFTFKYIGSASGTAINNAKAGNGGPSVLVVHSASLENQFVAGGYSYQNHYGNALFTNDFVLAASTTDPAGVATAAPNNIALAFAKIAAAGVAGHASFLSRGGNTTASGTTTKEHAIWALVASSGLTPSGVTLCTVSAADGGGMTPITSASKELAGGACPDNGTVDGTTAGDIPSWYIINAGVSQATNVNDAAACTEAGAVANGCYVFTDRGTYDYLANGAVPAGAPNTIPNLAIVTRNDSASAPGGVNELTNYFHAYIINPSVAGESVNLPAAEDFVSFITSPTVQGALASYLNDTADPAGAPFKADASPLITASGILASVTAGQKVTVSGTVTNQEPGYPAVSGQPVSVDDVIGGLDLPVATGTTTATGGYSIAFTPPATGSYQVTTGAISQIEEPSLNYGDILSPGSSAPTSVTVSGTATITHATASTGSVQVSGTVGPAGPVDGNARVTLLARRSTSKGAFDQIGGQSIGSGLTTFAVNGSLVGGKWTIEVQYSDPGSFSTVTSATQDVTVASHTNRVSLTKVTLNKGTATVSGTLGEAPASTSATVKLFALSLGKVTSAQPTAKQTAESAVLHADATGATFRRVASATVRVGRTTYTIKHTFKRGYRYALQLQYTHKGQATAYSGFQYVTIR